MPVVIPPNLVLVTFTFSEAIINLPIGAITVPNCSIYAAPFTEDNIIWYIKILPDVGVYDTSNVITLDMTQISDSASNIGIGTSTSPNYTVNTMPPDATAPTCASITIASYTISTPQQVTVVFDEAVTNVLPSNFTVPNCSITTAPSSIDNITWVFAITPNPGINISGNVISINVTGITDMAGNAAAGSLSSGAYAVNTFVAPVLTAWTVQLSGNVRILELK